MIDLISVEHLYYIPLWGRKNIGREFQCTECKVGQVFDPLTGCSAPRNEVLDQSLESLLLLAEKTSPWPLEKLHTRLQLEDELRAGLLEPQERHSLMAEAMDNLLVLLVRKMNSDWHMLPWALVFIFLFIPSIIVCVLSLMTRFNGLSHPIHHVLFMYALASTPLLILTWLIIWKIRSPRIAARKYALPKLARSLAAFRPSHDEVHSMLDLAKTRGSPLGKLLKVEEIDLAIQHELARGA
ncbi:MAG: hypothetical protein IPK69_12375 [Phycisphaerales bacterium]|nr:MAG: hypothetical protein IPK69_12375 [Phycisphaerales bacterium]